MSSTVPPQYKPIYHYIKLSDDHLSRDPIVSYFAKLYAIEKAREIDMKSPECREYIGQMLSQLEKMNNIGSGASFWATSQAHLEDYALKMFDWADCEDRAGRFTKNVVKSFYTAGLVMDVLSTFGELLDDMMARKKYAKLKAAYIHRCLKSGEIPISGPLVDDDQDDSAPSAEVGGSSSNVQDNTAHGSYQLDPHSVVNTTPPSQETGNVAFSVDLSDKAAKYCKFAISALGYEDVNTAVENLEKALRLLKTGKEE